jgi:hypothetical protein
MNLTFTGHRIVLQNHNQDNIIISSTNKILCFAINEKYIAVCEDWQHLESGQNTTIYDLKGTLLFSLESAPRSLYEKFGYYSMVSFKSENILVAQSNDYRYEIDLEKREFIKEEFTK